MNPVQEMSDIDDEERPTSSDSEQADDDDEDQYTQDGKDQHHETDEDEIEVDHKDIIPIYLWYIIIIIIKAARLCVFRFRTFYSHKIFCEKRRWAGPHL